jgi:hypothetical protein
MEDCLEMTTDQHRDDVASLIAKLAQHTSERPGSVSTCYVPRNLGAVGA